MGKWECPECGRSNPDSRDFCFSNRCNGMSDSGFRKVAAVIGIMTD